MKVASYIHDCWHCGGPGIAHVGCTYICPKCDVTWRPVAGGKNTLPDFILYGSIALPVVDFSDPAVVSSIA